jgi:hypothetical protein
MHFSFSIRVIPNSILVIPNGVFAVRNLLWLAASWRRQQADSSLRSE